VSILLYEYNDKDRTPLQYVTFGTARASRTVNVVPNEPFSIVVHMHSLAHEFRVGSRIAIAITGSLCGYAENPHTGEPPDKQSKWRSAAYGIRHGPGKTSRIALPVLTVPRR
jgi:predicted acyl esterase